MNQEIERLESKLAHLELAYEQLNQVVYEQAKKLDVTLKQLETLHSQLRGLSEEGDERPYSAEDERPPHY